MRRQQQGAALITVLMIVAVVVVIAVNMTGRLQLQLQRQLNLQQQKQAFWYALAAEEFTRVLLTRTVVGQETVHLQQDWALQGAAFPVDDGMISGNIRDLQACFNLNALQPAASATAGAENKPNPAQPAFQQLLEQVAPELTMSAEYLTARIIDWLDADSLLLTAGSAEQDDYAALRYPYYAANTLMATETELRVILDVTVADYQLLLPYVCVLPDSRELKINVNTLTEETAALLSAIIPSITLQVAQDLIASRPEEGFASVEDLLASSQLAGVEISDDAKAMLAVTSTYFRLDAITSYRESGFMLTSIMHINNNNKVTVLARRIGGLG